MVGWHQRLDGYEFEQAQGNDEGLVSLACSSPQACNELDTTWRLKNKEQVSREQLRHETDEFLSGVRVYQWSSSW